MFTSGFQFTDISPSPWQQTKLGGRWFRSMNSWPDGGAKRGEWHDDDERQFQYLDDGHCRSGVQERRWSEQESLTSFARWWSDAMSVTDTWLRALHHPSFHNSLCTLSIMGSPAEKKFQLYMVYTIGKEGNHREMMMIAGSWVAVEWSECSPFLLILIQEDERTN